MNDSTPTPRRPSDVLRRCEQCGQSFVTPRFEVMKGWGRFCSKKCSNDAKIIPDKIRFWNYVVKTDSCWLWSGGKDKDGYGSFSPTHCERIRAHRYSYILHKGEIPPGMCILHTCDTPACVNPEHLWAGSVAENNTDRARKGRSATGERNGSFLSREKQQGVRNAAAKLTEDDVREIRRLYATGLFTHQELASEYGMGKSMIGNIVNRASWKHI